MDITPIWVVPEGQGGIRTYADALWPAVRDELDHRGKKSVAPWKGQLNSKKALDDSIACIAQSGARLVHIQHEFGLFGSKIPFFYLFPRWVNQLRQKVPGIKVVATAHTVLSQDFLYPWRGRGWQTPLRWVMNYSCVPMLRPLWMRGTWGELDGVVVHSKIQSPVIQASCCLNVAVIPHFVPRVLSPVNSSLKAFGDRNLQVVIFGYFSPEKGQDIAIEAMRYLPKTVHLLLAGGVRRDEDKFYLEKCKSRIEEWSLSDRVIITGFLKSEEIDEIYSKADLVLAPFRETSGSGSLAQAFARNAVILASDLPLNREIAERVCSSLVFFRSEDPLDCARQIERLLSDSDLRAQLKQGASNYAALCSPEVTAQKHVEFYQKCFDDFKNQEAF